MKLSNSKKFLHIFVPAFGESPYLSDTLTSVTRYTNSDEVLVTVIDDASPSNHVYEIASNFASNNVNYVRNPKNLGLGENFKLCMSQSKGYFTMVIGSDDILINDPCAELRKIPYELQDFTLYQLGVTCIDETGKFSSGIVDQVKKVLASLFTKDNEISNKKLSASLLIGDWMYWPAIIWKTSELHKLEWNTAYKSAVDLHLLLSLAKCGAVFKVGERESFAYRRHSKSVSSELASTGFRFQEELRIHKEFGLMYLKESEYLLAFIGFLALSVRLHAALIGIKIIFKNRKQAVEILKLAFSL